MSRHGRKDHVAWYISANDAPPSLPSTSLGVGVPYPRVPTSDQSDLPGAPTYQTYPTTDVDVYNSDTSADQSLFFNQMYAAQPQWQQPPGEELGPAQFAGSPAWSPPSTATSASPSHPTTRQTHIWQDAAVEALALSNNGWSKDFFTTPNEFLVGAATRGIFNMSNTRSNGPDPPLGSSLSNPAVDSGLDNNRAMPWSSPMDSVAFPSSALSAEPAPVAAAHYTPPLFEISQPNTPQMGAGSRLIGNKATRSQRPAKELETEARAKTKRDNARSLFLDALARCIGHEPKAGQANQLAMATEVLSEYPGIKAERDLLKSENARLRAQNEKMGQALRLAQINGGKNVMEIMQAFPTLSSV